MQCAQWGLSHGRRVRILTFAVALLTAGVSLTGWAAPASTATLERVRETGKITLGYRTDAPPFSFKDDAGNADGFAIALCKDIAANLKETQGTSIAIEWVPVTIEDQFQALRDGKIDLLCGAAETLTSRKDVDFSTPIFPGGIGALLRADAPIGLREVLSGSPPSGPLWRGRPAQVLEKQTFAVVEGTPSEKWLADRLDKFALTAKVAPVKSYEAGVQSVLDGSADVFFADRSVLLDSAKRHPSASDLKVLDREFSYAPVAIAVQRGDADFRDAVDAALSQFFGSKEFRSLYVKWFGEPDEGTDTFYKFSTLPE